MKLRDLCVTPVRTLCVDHYLQQYHYLKSTPAGAKYRFVVTAPLPDYPLCRMVGAAMWGRPVSRHEDQVNTLELTRFYLEDACPKNSESYVLARMIRYLRDQGYARLISYADPLQGHTGSIYKAVGFRFMGKTKSGTWGNRRGRTSVFQQAKLKYEWRGRR